jgi:phage-related baseplate assembly protein
MATLTIANLRSALSRSQALQTMLGFLEAAGFEVSSWQAGSKQRQFLTAHCTTWADLTETQRATVALGTNRYSSGPALKEYTFSAYGRAINPAVKTVGPYRLTQSGSVGQTIAVGQLRLRSASGAEFTNTTGGSIGGTPGDILDITIEAVLAGAHGNVANSSITTLVTPLAGITGSNSIGTPWYTTVGQDQESDDSVKETNETQWATVGLMRTAAAVIHLAKRASSVVGRARLNDQNPRGAGTVDVYIASAAGVITDAAVIAAVQAFFDARIYGQSVLPKRWQVFASAAASVNVVGTIYYDPAFASATVQADATQAIQDYINGAPLGGYSYAPGPTNVISRNDLIALVEGVEGVESFVLTTPAADQAITNYDAPVAGTITLTMTPIA